MPKSLALSICVLFISRMQLVNGAQFLIVIFYLLLGFAAAAVFGTFVIALTSIYASQ